tara:strand:- start:44662 stop:45603 length:942 start_codon:yes stop_codon:yes gene_type:complete
MKLIIQIPCYNEEKYLPIILSELPKKLNGVDNIEWLIIDDGSEDDTIKIAKKNGVDHIVKHNKNKGLASAFKSGLQESINLGADIIVNTDADNQYPSKYIKELIAPIVEGKTDIVIGDRETDQIAHFSYTKKLLQKFGSWVVRKISKTDIPDAPSGFRAYSREAALQLNILSDYTYTIETIIQAGKKNLKMSHIPIKTNPDLRESRLLKNIFHYVFRSAKTMFKIFLLYEPLKFFSILSLPFILFGFSFWVRFLVLISIFGDLRGAYIQSVIVGGISILIGIFLWCLGLIGESLAKNRMLLEEQLYLYKKNHQ